MKYLITAIILAISLSITAPAEAGIFRNRRSHSYRVPRTYWSPGILLGLIGQNRGPAMVWRGDWVLR
jgi:hypothetical protein